MRVISTFFAILILFSSCASILSKKYQSVEVQAEPSSVILVDGESAKTVDGKVLLKRDYKAKQITVKREGYMDENIVAPPYKKAPFYIMSWIPFVVILAPALDKYKKSYNYPKSIAVERKADGVEMKPEGYKNLMVNKTSFKVDPSNLKYRFFRDYKVFLRKKDKWEPKVFEDDEMIDIDRAIFSDALNEILVNKGYVDTTSTVLKNSYSNNLYVNATITGMTVHETNLVADWNYYRLGRIFYMDLDVKWDILNVYKEEVYSLETSVTSGEFATSDEDEEKIKGMYLAVKDALEYGFAELMSEKEVKTILGDDEILIDKGIEDVLSIQNSGRYVSNLNEAIESSVTIKGDNSHGSGFIIGSDGYLLTNYHVISNDTEKMEVILNNKESFSFEVVRISKSNDLALLKIQKSGLIPFQISNQKEYFIAEDIYAVGTPTAQDLSQSVSRGIISGVRDLNDGQKLIQTDASINSGNSGGALVNKEGKVLGVVSSKVKGIGIEGVAFGIPSNQILAGLNIKIGD